MGLTNFPNGVTSFGIPVMGSGPDLPATSGKYFFVNNSTGVDSPSYGTTIEKPFATIDYAIGKCTANASDVIVVLPGHSETSSANGTVFDVAGVRLVGLGTGKLRPTIIASANNSIVVSANNVEISNIMITASANAITPIIRVTGGHLTLSRVDYFQNATDCLTNAFLLTAAGANNMTIKNCYHACANASNASGTGWIILTAANNARITDNFMWIIGANAANGSVIQGTGTLSSQVLISRNTLVSAGGTAVTGVISMGNNSTGIASWNIIGGGNNAAASAFTDSANLTKYQNYSIAINAGGNSAILLPAV